MSAGEHDLVELVPTDEPVRATGGTRRWAGDATDTIEDRPSWIGPVLERWRWWAGADLVSRTLAASAAAVLAAAAGLAVTAALRHPSTRTVTISVVDPAPRLGIDALGCPSNRRCGLREPTAMEGVLRVWPGHLEIVAASETYDLSDGRVYRRELVGAPDGTTLPSAKTIRVFSECAPGSLRAQAQTLPGTFASHAGAFFGLAVSEDPDGCTTLLQYWLDRDVSVEDVMAVVRSISVVP